MARICLYGSWGRPVVHWSSGLRNLAACALLLSQGLAEAPHSQHHGASAECLLLRGVAGCRSDLFWRIHPAALAVEDDKPHHRGVDPQNVVVLLRCTALASETVSPVHIVLSHRAGAAHRTVRSFSKLRIPSGGGVAPGSTR